MNIINVDYYFSALPLLGLQLAIPPLSYALTVEKPPEVLEHFFRFFYSILPREFLAPDFLESLMYTISRERIEISYAIISHLFVHVSYGHLLNNVTAMVNIKIM